MLLTYFIWHFSVYHRHASLTGPDFYPHFTLAVFVCTPCFLRCDFFSVLVLCLFFVVSLTVPFVFMASLIPTVSSTSSDIGAIFMWEFSFIAVGLFSFVFCLMLVWMLVIWRYSASIGAGSDFSGRIIHDLWNDVHGWVFSSKLIIILAPCCSLCASILCHPAFIMLWRIFRCFAM